MHWIALSPSREDERTAWGWRALQFTPRVAQVDEALLLEVAASERLFGGRRRLLRRLLEPNGPLASAEYGQGATSLIAMALLRLTVRGEPVPRDLPAGLPLQVLTAAQAHGPILARAGIRTWGELRALPRVGVARRFGTGLLDALDAAWGERPERYTWLQLPEVFDLQVDLAQLATSAPELMDAAHHLLAQLQVWLQARHRGVLALELEWALDLRRHNGVRLPSHQQLVVRTAEPTQAMAHLRRLVAENLERTPLAAPANQLRLRSLETAPWGPSSHSLLPEDHQPGERLHQLVERLSARLGAHQVQVARLQADWRPERMQRWLPAVAVQATQGQASPTPSGPPSQAVDPLYPPWLLPQPLRLEVRDNRPWYQGPLRLLTRRQRVETGWWEAGGAVVRDCFIAHSETAGLLWVYCEHTLHQDADGARHRHSRWYLQGLYA